jgi:glutaredoxin
MFCHRTQEFLAEKEIAFENRDITADPIALVHLVTIKCPISHLHGRLRGWEIGNRLGEIWILFSDELYLEALQKLGYMTTPVTVIDGEVVVGFDRSKLERLLGVA